MCCVCLVTAAGARSVVVVSVRRPPLALPGCVAVSSGVQARRASRGEHDSRSHMSTGCQQARRLKCPSRISGIEQAHVGAPGAHL